MPLIAMGNELAYYRAMLSSDLLPPQSGSAEAITDSSDAFNTEL